MPDYIDLRGHQTYCYEWENNGEAVVMLHGGLSQTSHWDYVLTPDLEPDFHLFAYDRTGHGYTGDQEGSFHFEFQIREAIAYLEDVVKEPAHLVGWSDGGNIAMSVAIARPELVKSLVLIGANYNHSGTVIELPFTEPSDEDKAEYAATSPDAFHTQNEKIKKMLRIWETEPNIPLSDLAKIECPTLIIAGDDDVISHEHTLAMYRAIDLGQLAIIPGTSHIAPKEKPALFSAIVQQFLTDLNYPMTKMPIRRVSNQPEE
jgi:pimeloyl-ACP methyl ester carboxylesterase